MVAPSSGAFLCLPPSAFFSQLPRRQIPPLLVDFRKLPIFFIGNLGRREEFGRLEISLRVQNGSYKTAFCLIGSPTRFCLFFQFFFEKQEDWLN